MNLETISRVAKKHPFWRSVEVLGRMACWPWKDSRDSGGYGIVGRDRAHRIAFELHQRRNLLPGEVVRHSCDNPVCCNPLHLLAGSNDDNVADRTARNRSARGAANGRSKLSNSQVLTIAGEPGSYVELGKKYGVSPWSIRDIKIGRNWSWLTSIPAKPSNSRG